MAGSPKKIRGGTINRYPVTYEKKDSRMHCPGCRKYSLKRNDVGVACSYCGYTLSPGEETRYRLYELLK
jgi:ribosomal protein L37AE/L43A